MRQSIQVDVYASVLITLVPAILSFGLRFYARRIKKVPLWWDDWLAVVGFVCAYLPCCCTGRMVSLISFLLRIGISNRLQCHCLLLFVPQLSSPSNASLTVSQVLYHGMGLHLEDLTITPEKALYYSSIMDVVQEMTYSVSIGTTQLSLLALYWRLFRTARSAKISIIVMTVLTAIWLIVRVSEL